MRGKKEQDKNERSREKIRLRGDEERRKEERRQNERGQDESRGEGRKGDKT